MQESGESQLLHEVEGWGARGREVAEAADLHPDCSCTCKLWCECASDRGDCTQVSALVQVALSVCVLSNAALPPALPAARALPAFPSREQQSLVAARSAAASETCWQRLPPQSTAVNLR